MAARDASLAAHRDALLLREFVFVPPSAYAELAAFERPALAANYFELPAPDTSPLSIGRARSNGSTRGPCAARRTEAGVDRRDAAT